MDLPLSVDSLGERSNICSILVFLVKMEQLVRRNKEKQIYSISDKYQYAMGVDPLFYQRMHTYLLIIQKTYS
jgi:hypothetical protein